MQPNFTRILKRKRCLLLFCVSLLYFNTVSFGVPHHLRIYWGTEYIEPFALWKGLLRPLPLPLKLLVPAPGFEFGRQPTSFQKRLVSYILAKERKKKKSRHGAFETEAPLANKEEERKKGGEINKKWNTRSVMVAKEVPGRKNWGLWKKKEKTKRLEEQGSASPIVIKEMMEARE